MPFLQFYKFETRYLILHGQEFIEAGKIRLKLILIYFRRNKNTIIEKHQFVSKLFVIHYLTDMYHISS